MVSKKLFDELNDQVNFEIYSSYVYLAMASYAESIDLSGFANFFRVQVQEELAHAMKLYDYIFQKDGVVTLDEIPKPKAEYKDILEVIEEAYAHEKLVTRKIYDLIDSATEEREHATISILKWYVDEQVEEEDSFNNLVKKVKRAKDNQVALYMLDDELAQRVYVPPTTTN
ncbi:ferritin [Clostridioides mangenotii]|uniref:ferritin n=1 Tax=Metaclostridioides mangenotii TaxID=1540 RepID=UPI001C100E7D|nr:ferritin [Clostridioides mangenotii]MBU5306907.1 ferritin [Clostridioides mangenotii]